MVCICFPAETTVTTKQGGKRMDEVRLGDEVLTSNSTKCQKWSKLYAWGHREPNATAEFLVLTMSSGEELKISSNHLIFVADLAQIGGKVAKIARQVSKGDKLFHLGECGFMQLLLVTKITSETLTGVYAPFTMSGHFLANGFLVGCYAEIGDFKLAHAAVAPLRAWYRLQQSSSKGDASLEGIHGYARKLMRVRESLPIPLRNWVN